MKSKTSRAWLGAVVLLLVTGTVWAQQTDEVANVARGKRLFMRCAACHEVSVGGPAKIGPHLSGLLGRPSVSVPGYAYSPAMKAKPFGWDEKVLEAWLIKPTDVVPGTTMAFAGMPDAGERNALISYLKSIK
jgi:cytochrome c